MNVNDIPTTFSVVEVVDGCVTEELAFFEMYEDAYTCLRIVSQQNPHLCFDIEELKRIT